VNCVASFPVFNHSRYSLKAYLTVSDLPESFEALAESRRQWIDNVLRPWCRQASLKQLRQAEVEWLDVAGRVDVTATLWTWAWERFPELTHPDMAGVNETNEVQVILRDGTELFGFPDSRRSERGMLVLVARSADRGHVRDVGPTSIDDIQHVKPVSASNS
jgi:hypothetical protein